MIKEILFKKSFNVKTASNNTEYGDIVLIKKGREYPGKIWSITEEKAREINENSFFTVEGQLEKYGNKDQLKIIKLIPINESEVNLKDFIDGVDGEKYVSEITNCIKNFENKELQQIISYCIEKYKDKLKYNVAAEKFHHDCKGGLAYHTATMLKSATAICGVYDYLNKDILHAGVILHDLLKCEEISCNNMGLEINYTVKGRLLGHIPMAVLLIENACNDLKVSEETKVILQHLVLCHHGQGDWGSPVKPLIPEGQVLHVLDKLDADLFNFERKLKEVNEGEFTEKVFQLDNRVLYKMKS